MRSECHSPPALRAPQAAAGASAAAYPGANHQAAINASARPNGVPLAQVQAQLLEGMRPEQSGGYGYNPQRAVPRPTVQKTVTIRNEVNLKKPSLCATPHPDDPSKLLLEFKFDASADCQISVYYLATEPGKADGAGAGAGYSPKDAGSTPPKEERRKGLGQSYKVPLSHPLDTGAYSEAELCWQPARAAPAGREDRYPIIVCLEATSTQSGSAQSQTTFATLARIVGEGGGGGEAEWVVKPLKQKIQVGASSYELQEIFGIDQSRETRAGAAGAAGASLAAGAAGDEDNGTECVICMSEPKDTTVLPCRHMCMCASCARSLRVQSNKCPVCRSTIDSLLQIKVSKGYPSRGSSSSTGAAAVPAAGASAADQPEDGVAPVAPAAATAAPKAATGEGSADAGEGLADGSAAAAGERDATPPPGEAEVP